MDERQLNDEVLGASLTFINDGKETKYSVRDIFEINDKQYAVISSGEHETVMELKEDGEHPYFIKLHPEESDRFSDYYKYHQ